MNSGFKAMKAVICLAVLLIVGGVAAAQSTTEGVVQMAALASGQSLAESSALNAKSATEATALKKVGEAVSNVTAAAANATQVPGEAQANAPQASQPTTAPAPQTQAAPPLRVMVGKSILINTTDKLRRVSVTDPDIADAMVITPTQVMVQGRAPGEVSLLMWDEQERSRTFDLRVDVDLTSAQEEVNKIFPDQKVNLSASRNALMVYGHVATKEDAERVGLLVGAYSKNVVNVLTYGPLGAQEISLEVRFAEVDRIQLMQLGANLFSTGAANTFGATQTGQFSPFTGANVGAIPSDVKAGTVTGNSVASGAIGNSNFHQPGMFGMNDLMNVFLFRPDINLGAVIKAMQQKNVLQILAEPNLMAMNGKEASFLAGGEFPIPIVQGTGGQNSISIQFKEFGVRLNFVPLITPAGAIHLHVKPEVSTLDFANGITLSGFQIPALNTRRAETDVEIQDGQSFVIAGLMDNRVSDVVSKVPGLGDIPILGTFFKSKNLQKNKSELMVLVTAHRVQPSTQQAPGPKFPEPFMDHKSEAAKPAGGQ